MPQRGSGRAPPKAMGAAVGLAGYSAQSAVTGHLDPEEAAEVGFGLGSAVVFRLGGGSWKAGGLARVLSPPSERSDPVTARWLIPGGPLDNPERDSFDPDHGAPVKLVGPIPRQLAEG